MKEDFLAKYQESHQNPWNRLLHYFGIPMIVFSLPLFFLRWKLAAALFILGWAFQFAGHAIEGKRPAFFGDIKFLFIGVFWWAKKVFKK